MKTKLFTLLTLLLCICSGAWADYRTIFTYDATVSGSITTTPNTATVTLTGVSQGTGNSMTGIKFTNAVATDKYIKVDLPSGTTLAANDKILITHFESGTDSPNNTYGTCLSATTSTTIPTGCTFGIPS